MAKCGDELILFQKRRGTPLLQDGLVSGSSGGGQVEIWC